MNNQTHNEGLNTPGTKGFVKEENKKILDEIGRVKGEILSEIPEMIEAYGKRPLFQKLEMPLARD